MDEDESYADFDDLLDKMRETYYNKNSDYNNNSRWSNFDMCNEIGIPTVKGIIVRMCDKFTRILSLTNKHYMGVEPAVKDEKLEDTLFDMAVYSLIAILALKRKEGHVTDQWDSLTARQLEEINPS